MTRRELPQTKDIKLMIIQNFIDYFTSDEKEREDMYECAWQYVLGDDYDEIEDVFEVSKHKRKSII